MVWVERTRAARNWKCILRTHKERIFEKLFKFDILIDNFSRLVIANYCKCQKLLSICQITSYFYSQQLALYTPTPIFRSFPLGISFSLKWHRAKVVEWNERTTYIGACFLVRLRTTVCQVDSGYTLMKMFSKIQEHWTCTNVTRKCNKRSWFSRSISRISTAFLSDFYILFKLDFFPVFDIYKKKIQGFWLGTSITII